MQSLVRQLRRSGWRRLVGGSLVQTTRSRTSLTEAKKKIIASKQSWMCNSCTRMLPPTYEIDHILPVALGGNNGSKNLQALCKACHSLKTQQDLVNIRQNGKGPPSLSDLHFTTEDITEGINGDSSSITSTTRTTAEFNTTAIDLQLGRLNEQQKNAVLHVGSTPVRVVAGPGTGKTAVLTTRVASMIRRFGIRPKHILTLTFTNRAAREMRSRIVDLVGSPSIAEQISMGTFHATMLGILRSTIQKVGVVPTPNIEKDVQEENGEGTRRGEGEGEGEEKREGEGEGDGGGEGEGGRGEDRQGERGKGREGINGVTLIYPYSRGFGVYDETETLKVIRDIIRKTLGWTVEEAKPSDYQALISSAKNHGFFDAHSYATSPGARQSVARVFALYEETLRSRNQIDFDDMLWLTVSLLRQDTGERQKCQRRWRHVLVDEFQDTNGMQYEFLRLMGSSVSDTSDCTPSTLFVVGDADQAIYGFRGADHRNQNRYDVYFKPDVYQLSRNYRSVQPVLNSAHQIILPNYRAASNAEPLIVIPENPLQGIEYDHEHKNSPVAVCRVEDEIEESCWIVDECLRLHEAEEIALLEDPTAPRIDIAILMRTNAQFRVIERELIRQGVSHIVVNGTKFFDVGCARLFIYTCL